MKFYKVELKHILHWANYTIEDSLHWGDGAAYLPQEEGLLNKIKNLPEEVILNDSEVDTIYVWAINYLRGGTLMLGEDIIVLKKLLEFYNQEYMKKKDNRIKEKIETIENML